MSLLDVLRSGVAIADGVTKPLQATIAYERFTGQDAYGSETWAPAVPMKALCDWKQRQVDGSSVGRISITFLDIKEMVAVTGGLGVGIHDRITIPDGMTGPINDLSGFIDAGTGHPLATEVFLG